MIRPGKDTDSPGVIALIGRCWSDYPGVILDVEGEEPGLLAPATHFEGRGGAFWVAEDGGAVTGMAAAVPDGRGWQVCKLYVHPDRHGAGLGHRLLDTVEAHAISAGATGLHLWSDTRFTRAHRFYEKRSYVRHGAIRALDDISRSLEFHYAKPVQGVQALDAAAAESAVPRLSALLVACVDGGAAVSFLPPLTPAVARAHMAEAARGVAQGRCALLAAWRGGVLAGTVRLRLDTPPDQRHRAEAADWLVDPAHRGQGLGGAVMRAAEDEARRAGRTLLTLHTRAGDAAERLLHGLGWTETGAIPGYTRDADGAAHGTTILYKLLGR